MPVLDSLYFVYDNIKSTDMGILNVNVNSGLLNESFLPTANIKEVKVRGNPRPYYQGVEYEPLTLKLNFMFENTWDESLIKKVTQWLGQKNYYKELYFSDNISRIFYAMYTGSPALLHNGLKQGYVEIEMRNIDCYTYSPVYTSQIYDLSINNTSTDIVFDNLGDVECKPNLYMQKVGNGDISIINLSDGGKEFKFTNLANDEVIFVDNEREIITTSLTSASRYNNFNDNYLSIPQGRNILRIIGTAKLYFKYQFSIFQG